jgi:predicted phage terminase large subunit-like protein
MASRTLPTDKNLNPTPADRLFKLIINVPPRSLKSVIFSVAFKAFILGHYPHERIIGASFSSALAKTFNSGLRDVLKSEWYRQMFPNTHIKKDTDMDITTTMQGHSKVTSLGGNIIGQGGNYLLTDDILSPEVADSDTQCAHANDWFENSLFPRRDDKRIAVTIVVMQRLREYDLTGYLLAKNAELPTKERWTLVCLPAKFSETQTYNWRVLQQIADPTTKKPIITWVDKTKTVKEEELLNANRDTHEILKSLQVDIGLRKFATQYLQQPAPFGGSLMRIEDLRKYTVIPANTHVVRTVQSWDTAIKTLNNSDFSVGMTWKETPTGHYLVDVIIGKWEYPQLKALIQDQAAIHQADAVLIEDKASGQQLIQELRFTTQLPVVPITPKSQPDWKTIRAASCGVQIENGMVYIHADAQYQPWYEEMEKQFTYFPNGKNDDMVDAFCQYLDWAKKSMYSTYKIRSL